MELLYTIVWIAKPRSLTSPEHCGQ